VSILNINQIHPIAKARRLQDDVWKLRVAQKIQKEIVPQELRDENDPVQGLVAHELSEVISQIQIVVRFDL
jgi:hypothetical protein